MDFRLPVNVNHTYRLIDTRTVNIPPEPISAAVILCYHLVTVIAVTNIFFYLPAGIVNHLPHSSASVIVLILGN
jgi:hypothetical protein